MGMKLEDLKNVTVEELEGELQKEGSELAKKVKEVFQNERNITPVYLSVELFVALYYDYDLFEGAPELKARRLLMARGICQKDYDGTGDYYQNAFGQECTGVHQIAEKLEQYAPGEIGGRKLSELAAALRKLQNPGGDPAKDNKYMKQGFEKLGLMGAIEMGKTKKDETQLERKIKEALKYSRQIILTGAPGTGKTFTAKEVAKALGEPLDGKPYEFVQFHPTYDYSDFVEGLRPVNLEGDQSPTFVRMDGVFKKFCRKVVQENQPEKKHFFLIDEINRADLAKVFGDLMYCLEYRVDLAQPEDDAKRSSVQTPYANLQTYDAEKGLLQKDEFAKGFFIPKNVYLIGTMNDIDRSVEAVDFAMRRRFHWIEVKAEDVMDDALAGMQARGEISSDPGKLKSMKQTLASLNQIISGEDGARLGLSDAYHVGPAYLKGCGTEFSEAELWEHRIKPLLQEYLRGRRASETKKFWEECGKLFPQAKAGKGA